MPPQGFRLHRCALPAALQTELAGAVLEAARAAPLRRQTTRFGVSLSVAQTSLGALGWISDRRGYRYESTDPLTGAPWPPMPRMLLDIWRGWLPGEAPPDSCLVNHYADGAARLGLHRDLDESDLTAPVLSISLGAPAVFRIGGADRRDPTEAVVLRSGDVLALEGPARNAFHGIDRILPGGQEIVPGGGRLNLTLRRAGVP